MSDLLPLLAFWSLSGVRLAREGLSPYRRKPLGDWLLDLSGLFVQGWLIPWLQVVGVVAALRAVVPSLEGALVLPFAPWLCGFLLSFVAVDYVYYWNHRLLHHPRLFFAHLVHHTLSEMDVLGTSRNTLWTSFLIVYLWLHGAALFFLRDTSGYVFGVALGAALDLFRHSTFDPKLGPLGRVLDAVLILPRDHAWHHAESGPHGNYGANLKLWDELHGTLIRSADRPQRLGLRLPMGLARRLFFPVKP